VRKATRNVDFVFHAAALKHVPSCEFFPLEARRTNVLGSANVVEAGERNMIHGVFELGDPPGQGHQLLLHVREVLRVGHQPAVHPVLVPGPPGLDLLDVGVGLALLPGEVVDDDLHVARPAVERRALRAQGGELLGLGQGREPVTKQVEQRVELLDVQQLQLREGVGFQRVLLRSGTAGAVSGRPGRSRGR